MTIAVAGPPGTSTRSAVLVHGFTRGPADLVVLSDALLSRGVTTLRPGLGSLWWPRSTNNPDHLTRMAVDLRRVLPPGPVSVVGHSAGAAAGAWLAAELRGAGTDVDRLVLVDGVESPTRLIRRSWPRLAGLSVRALCAPPSRCNRDGALARWLSGQPGDIEILVLPGMGHGDIEGGSRAVYRWACGDSSDARTVADVLARTVDWACPATPGP